MFITSAGHHSFQLPTPFMNNRSRQYTRRQMLQTTGGLLLASATGQLSAAPAPHREKVIVVGGGIGGLSCAYDLMERGHEVTLLEASRRYGKFPTSEGQDPPVGMVVAGSNPRNSMMRRRWDSGGRFWFFSHFSTAVSVMPIANVSASLRCDNPRSTRFWRRYSPRVLGAVG